jgi:hypothetical protein
MAARSAQEPGALAEVIPLPLGRRASSDAEVDLAA